MELKTHYYQFHLNPHHLSPQDVRLYRLSNFLVRLQAKTEESPKTEFPGLYRCHQCFNLFNQTSSLIQHLATHEKVASENEDQPEQEMPTRTPTKVSDIPVKAVKKTVDQKETKVHKLLSKVEEILAKKTAVDNLPPKVDKLSREDFEDVASRPKRRRRPEKRSQNKRVQLSRKSRSLGLLKLESMVVADELVSEAEDSDSGVEETPKESRRPQRECKSRTSTLVAISLAEQEYEQFDLDFGRYKSDVNKVSDVDLARMKNINKRVLLDKDNIPAEELNTKEKDEKLESPSDEINISSGQSLSSEDSVFSDSKSSSTKEEKSSSKKTDRKRTARSAKARKRRKNRSSTSVARKVKLRHDLKSEGEESSTKENDLYDELVELEGLGPEKRKSRGGKEDGGWVGMKGAVMEKARQVVQEVLEPPPAFVCLHCKAHFLDYAMLRSHRQGCKPTKLALCTNSKDSSSLKCEVFKTEVSEDDSSELYEYVTGTSQCL